MGRFFMILWACTLLVGCQDPVEAQIKRLVGQRLKDPGSAIYHDVRVHPSDALFIACGKVNAKNSFGAYEGDTNFILYAGNVRFELPDDTVAVSACCDVLRGSEPTETGSFDAAPRYAQTCGRLKLTETLR